MEVSRDSNSRTVSSSDFSQQRDHKKIPNNNPKCNVSNAEAVAKAIAVKVACSGFGLLEALKAVVTTAVIIPAAPITCFERCIKKSIIDDANNDLQILKKIEQKKSAITEAKKELQTLKKIEQKKSANTEAKKNLQKTKNNDAQIQLLEAEIEELETEVDNLKVQVQGHYKRRFLASLKSSLKAWKPEGAHLSYVRAKSCFKHAYHITPSHFQCGSAAGGSDIKVKMILKSGILSLSGYNIKGHTSIKSRITNLNNALKRL